MTELLTKEQKEEQLKKEFMSHLNESLRELCNPNDTYYEMVKSVVFECGDAIQYASEELRDDEDLVNIAIHNFGCGIYFHLSDRLKNNVSIIKKMIMSSSYMLENMSAEIRNDREIFKFAVSIYGCVLEIGSAEFRDDEEIVRIAVQENANAFQYASNRLRDNREIIILAIKQGKCSSILKYVSDHHRNDKELVRLAIQHNGYSIDGASEELQNDTEMARLAIETNPFVIHRLKHIHRDNPAIVSVAVKHSSNLLKYVSARLYFSKAFLIQIVTNDILHSEIAEFLKDDKELQFASGNPYYHRITIRQLLPDMTFHYI